MTVTGCANCAEMDNEAAQLQEDLQELEASKQTEIDALEASLSEIKEAVDWIKGYIVDIERELE